MDRDHDHALPTVPYNTNPSQPTSTQSTSAPTGDLSTPAIGATSGQAGETSESMEKLPMDDTDTLSGRGSSPHRDGGLGVGQPLPLLSPRGALGEGQGPRRTRTVDTHGSARRSGIDWIVPVEEKREPALRPRTASERLDPTMVHAKAEQEKYEAKAKWTGLALNAAIGLQILIGALITGLSAVTSGRQTSIMTSILGGLSTVVASYLARARGSNEPELSITRVKDLEQFLRECNAFSLDHGHTLGNECDAQLIGFRQRFEELLGNANGERRLSPV